MEDVKNPKIHDRLFKWLIASFVREFFKHYYPKLSVGEYEILDKEFVNRYEALKDSLEGDLFLLLEAKIDGEWQEVMIQLEHQSKKKNLGKRVFEYACYSWLLKQKPIWSIVIYTDNANWRKDVESEFYYGYQSKLGKQFHRFDVIKIKKEKSEQLIKKRSLLSKLLALKADDRKCDREELVREVLKGLEKIRSGLTNVQLLAVDQFIEQYKDISEDRYETIKKEVNMAFVASTINEYYEHIGEERGVKRGRKQGIEIGELNGKVSLLEELYKKGIITKKDFDSESAFLKGKLEVLKKKKKRNK